MSLCRKNLRSTCYKVGTNNMYIDASDGIITDDIRKRIEICKICNNRDIIMYIGDEEVWKCKLANRLIRTLIIEDCPNKNW